VPDIVEPTLADFADHVSPGSLFLRQESEIDTHEILLPYSHYLRQAWRELGLSGVLCVDGRPIVYLCQGARFTTQQKRERHRFAWNQGLVPLLIFLTPNQVEVHSAVKKPERDNLFQDDLSSLIPNLSNITETLDAVRLIRKIETGQFFQDNAEFFPANETVDQCLVENLIFTARRLKDLGWSLPQAHALLGRALFVSFLHERKFIKAHYYPDGMTCLMDMLNRPRLDEIKRLLYREFFARLKLEFNGTMFDVALASEERNIGTAHFDILRDFLSAQDMQSGQLTLDFWAYDFRAIPVETISAIYEEFMKEADLKNRRKKGAYYTPRNLAETTLHIALEGRYANVADWKVLDPACGSGTFLVAMFNLLAEQWRRDNSRRHKQTKAQALLDILQRQIRGVDVNPDACRITAFSLYLALFEKLQPIDVDEFKEKVRHEEFLPPLVLDKDSTNSHSVTPVIIREDFLDRDFDLENDFDLVIGNPPWESRGDRQIALHFAKRSADFLKDDGLGCLILPSTILVNRYGTLDGEWFRTVTVERIMQLADFRFLLFKATHPCFIIRFVKTVPEFEHSVAYDTPKVNRFDRRSGVIVIEPDDQKIVQQRDILEAALRNGTQAIWSRKFWGTPRDEAFLRRLDFFPRLSETISEKGWGGGVGFQPFYPGASSGDPKPLEPWTLSDDYLPNDDNFPQLILEPNNFVSLGIGLQNSILEREDKEIPALLDGLRRKPPDSVFKPPMVVFSNGFTKFAFSRYRVLFQDSLRSITSSREDDANLLRFLTAVLGSRLMQYQAFHSGSSNGIGRDKLHLYESLNMPFPLPNHDLLPWDSDDIISETASLFERIERVTKTESKDSREDVVQEVTDKLEELVQRYFSVSDAEKILIEDTLGIYQPSIHPTNLDTDIPALIFPKDFDRKRYADTLCEVLNRRARKQGIKINAEIMMSKALSLLLLTVIFTTQRKPYEESGGDEELWKALDRICKAATHDTGSFSYLRGFRYVESDRLHILKPATMRNWCRSAALNDADAIFEHLVQNV